MIANCVYTLHFIKIEQLQSIQAIGQRKKNSADLKSKMRGGDGYIESKCIIGNHEINTANLIKIA